MRNENRVTKLEVNVHKSMVVIDLSSFAVFSFLFVVAN